MIAMKLLVPKVLQYDEIKDDQSIYFIDDVINWNRLEEAQQSSNFPKI